MTTSIRGHSTQRVTVNVGDAELEWSVTVRVSQSCCCPVAAFRSATFPIWPTLSPPVDSGRSASTRAAPAAVPAPMEGLTPHDFAADVAGVIEGLDLAPAFVLGHALGNRIARTVAADRAGTHSRRDPRGPGRSATRSTASVDAIHVDRITDRSARRDELDGGLPKNASTVWERFKDARARSAAASQAAAAQATPLQDWWEPPGDVPYLVIQGMRDEAAPVENGHLLKEELGERGTVVDIPNAGHLQPLEAPGPVAETVIAFAR
jgi:pimeloyl-ACP methyl ester carboxylesterase